MTRDQIEGLPEKQAAEVLDAWVKARRPELPAALTLSSSKAHARLAKKAVYRLQSAGVAVALPTEAKEEPLSLKAAPVEFEGVLSMQLGSGERAFLAAAPIAGGGVEVFQGIVHDEAGLAQISSDRSNRSTWRKHVATLEADQGSRTMTVPFARVKLELGRALALSKRQGVDLDTEIEQALQRLGVTEVDPDVVVPPLEPTDEAGAADGAALHDFFELQQWLPSEPDLVKLSARVEALKVLPLSDAQRAEKSDAQAVELANEVFTPKVRLIYARRLLYTAELFDARGDAVNAGRLRAEARRLAHSSAPSPFAHQMFRKTLNNLAQSIATQLGLRLPK